MSHPWGELLSDHLDHAPVGRRADNDPLVRVGPVDELDGALPGGQDVALGQVRVSAGDARVDEGLGWACAARRIIVTHMFSVLCYAEAAMVARRDRDVLPAPDVPVAGEHQIATGAEHDLVALVVGGCRHGIP